MESGKSSGKVLSYLVGEERRLGEIVSAAEILPLLKGLVAAGAVSAALLGDDGDELWSYPADLANSLKNPSPVDRAGIFLEGEQVGEIRVAWPGEGNVRGSQMTRLVAVAVTTMAVNSLKRMLTTEMHTTVVSQSYQELVEINRKLAESESKYRCLAENLEKLVDERTAELKRTYARLVQREKMASVGQLAAGVAHEINTPLGFVASNLGTLRRYVERYSAMLDAAGTLLADSQEFQRKWKELRIDLIRSDMKDLLAQSLEGAERVRKIVADLKAFSHIDEPEIGFVAINEELDRTLAVMAHEIPANTVIVRNYGVLPELRCTPALLSQVFVNVIRNACQSRTEGLELRISTRSEGEAITIEIHDNGPGIAEADFPRIFEPFFTTREIGKGAGMGLAVAYEAITAHNGSIEAQSPAGDGANFIITLPVQGA